MGLFRDQEEDLPELRRLVSRLNDPVRRRDLSPEEWELATVAYGLHLSQDPDLLCPDSLSVYADFVSSASAEHRLNSLNRLALYVSQRKGDGWRALLLYAMGEAENTSLCTRAATLAATCATPSEEVRFTGIQAIVELLARDDAPPAMLGALLALSDTRPLSLLEPLCQLPLPRLRALLAALTSTLNSLSAEWLLQLLATTPALAQDITEALARLAAHTPLVADIVLPIPTWAYEKPNPQPLHAWTLAEYLPRMLPRLSQHLSPAQLHILRASFV